MAELGRGGTISFWVDATKASNVQLLGQNRVVPSASPGHLIIDDPNRTLSAPAPGVFLLRRHERDPLFWLA